MKLFKSKISAVIVAIIILAAAAVSFYAWSIFSSGGINIEASAEGEKIIGEPFDLKINLTNSSRNVLEETKIILEIPEGIAAVNGGLDQRFIEREVGSVDTGGVHQEIFRVLATPLENNVREFNVKLSYIPGGISARFEKNKKLSVEIGSPDIQLSLKTPEKIFSGEEFEITVDYKSAEEKFPSKIFLKMVYPDRFEKLSEEMSEETNMNGKLSVKGKVSFPDDASFDVKAQIFTNLLERDYLMFEEKSQILVSPSPLFFKITANGNDNLIAYPKDTLLYDLAYKNNTNVALQDITVRAKLTGDTFDFGTLDSKNAKFNIGTRTITWDSKEFEEQKLLNPGEEKTASFSIKLRENYPIRRLNDKNFILKVEANIESPTVPYLVSADKTVNYANLEIKVGGRIEVETRGLFRDAPSGILNKGPWPPKIGQPTQYTIHWLITNFATDIRDVEIRASLQDGVVATGVVKSNTTSPPEVGSESGEVVWKIDRLVATTGITGGKPEAIFQVEATPTAEKRGNYMPLISVTQVKAFDEFSETEILNSDDGVTTRLENDPTVVENEGKVIE